MIKKLYPTYYVNSVYHIDYNELKEKGINGLIFDIDNTLVPHFIKQGDEKLVKLFEDLRAQGFKISLVSNGKKNRVIKFNENLKVFAIHKARKPFTRNLKRAMEFMKTDKKSTVMIGDQVFTDVWAGNRLGISTVLVMPVSEKDEFVTLIKRGIEKKIVNAYLKYTETKGKDNEH